MIDQAEDVTRDDLAGNVTVGCAAGHVAEVVVEPVETSPGL